MKDVTSFSGRYSFLSNFSPASVYILIGTKWVRCSTVEHAYQASKTLSGMQRQAIVSLSFAADARAYGRNVRRVVYWNDVKKIVMLELLRQKFSRSALQRRLINTCGAELVDGNTWHDNFWGRCECNECADQIDGQNWLGRLLMRVREDVR